MVKIENIEKQRFKFCLTLENGQKFYLTKKQFYEKNFQIGQEIDLEEFNHWLLLNQYRSALDKAISMLARRPCSKGEIKAKLSHSGYSDQTIEMVLYKLERESLINDEEFARQWIQYRRSQNYGYKKIAGELKYTKYISQELIEKIFSENTDEENELKHATLIAQKYIKKYKNENDPFKRKQKVIRAIVQKGYSWDTANEACSRMINSDE